jgi:RNA polymerase sigma factor (sigma-70 family)
MMPTYLSWRGRRWVGEIPAAALPEPPPRDEDSVRADGRRSLLTALKNLPPRQRAVIVVRYFDDLSEAETARALDCSVGTVKRDSSRALAHLRAMPELASAFDSEVL